MAAVEAPSCEVAASSLGGGAVDQCDVSEAEVAAAAIVNVILEKGGFEVWKRYLQRRKFPFAVESMTEFILGHLGMCFVPHEPGDEAWEWAIEPDPVAPTPDSWARMHIPTRDKPICKPEESVEVRVPSNNSNSNTGRRRSNTAVNGRAYEPPPLKSRAFTLPKAEAKFSMEEELWRRDFVKKRVAQAQAKREAVDDDPDPVFGGSSGLPKPFETDLSDLPSLIERFKYEILGDHRRPSELDLDDLPAFQANSASAPSGATRMTRPNSAPALPRKNLGNGSRAGNVEHSRRNSEAETVEFVDGFRPLDNWQMKLLDAVAVQPGVTLDCCGQRKMGLARRPSGENRLSWREYKALGSEAQRPQSAIGLSSSKTNGDTSERSLPAPVLGIQRPAAVLATPASVAAALLLGGKSPSVASRSRPSSAARLKRPESAATLSRPRSAATVGSSPGIQPLVPPSPTARKPSSATRQQPRSSRIAPLGDPWKSCRPAHGRLLQLAS